MKDDVVARIASIEAFVEKGMKRIKRLRSTLDAAVAEIEGARAVAEALKAQGSVQGVLPASKKA